MAGDVVRVRTGRGGARPGAGRKPGSATKNNGRFVYVIHEVDETGVCKIGIANDPIKRLRAHQVSTWRRLVLARAFTAESSNAAMEIEASVHMAFSGLHVSGEWFRVCPERAISEISAASESSNLRVEPFEVGHLKQFKINQDGPRR